MPDRDFVRSLSLETILEWIEGCTGIEAAWVNLKAVGRLGELDCCRHGVETGDWCGQCNAEYKRARSENGDD